LSALPPDISSLIETVTPVEAGTSNVEVLVNKALLARIEVLEAKKTKLSNPKRILIK